MLFCFFFDLLNNVRYDEIDNLFLLNGTPESKVSPYWEWMINLFTYIFRMRKSSNCNFLNQRKFIIYFMCI